MKHERLVMVLLACWALTFSSMVRGATLHEFMGSYDWQSLSWAAGIALTGGSLRTIITLATDSRVVWSILREAWKDAVISLIAGATAYVALEALRGAGWAVASEIRFAAILTAGVMRMHFFTWAQNTGKAWLDAWTAKFNAQPLDPPKDTPP